jgi:methionyl-tRNA formyltransferase
LREPPRLRLGFAGTPDFAVPALDALHHWQGVCAVLTQPDRPAGRGQEWRPSPVKIRASQLSVPVFQPADLKSAHSLELVRSLGLDALVVAAYGLILPPAILECPRRGCINIHASLLPRWRGAAPIQRAILAGDAKSGITIMRMEVGLDTGPMLATRSIDIGVDETAKTLHDRLAQLGAELIVETLDALAAGGIREVPQPLEGVTYARKIDKTEALIDWRQDAVEVWRHIRAFNPWPIAETRLNGVQLRVWEAELYRAVLPGRGDAPPMSPGSVLQAGDQGIEVACGRGVLRILRLQLAGRKPLPAREFVQGVKLEGASFAPL